jgi:protein-S-isoprenylcysteine O-methyltransferase Ste14
MTSAGGKHVTRAGLARASVDVSLAAFCLFFVWAHASAFRETQRPSHAVIVVVELFFAAFFLLRTEAESTSRRPWDWIAAAGGVGIPLLLRPTAAEADVLLGHVLQLGGAVGALLGILSLNRSLAVVPATRALRSGGAYRVVRHPLYAAYTVGSLGYLASNWSVWNAGVVAVALAFQIARIHNEERWLARTETYREYMGRTRWRLLPYVF